MEGLRIKITSTPEGEAPKEIREKWIGLKLDGVAYESGMVTKIAPNGFSGFVTFIDTAIQALASRNREASKWWLNWRSKHTDSDVFLFEDSCYEVVDMEQDKLAFFTAFIRKGKTGLSPVEELVDYIMKD